MTELRMESYEIPAADLGRENPLPMFCSPEEDASIQFDPSVPEADRRYMGWRTGFRVLPYRMQDGYTRDRKPRGFQAIVLENEWLRALFLPELNGRLASLVYKPYDRELLHRNPVFQPANLALRNAWISGGVEWNMGQLGHNYFTCAPVFAARLTARTGDPILRIYEWERAKCFPWQVDFHLPADSPFLFARVRLINPHDREIPMYWWTNIAVDERPGARVLFPADTALQFDQHSALALKPLPTAEGTDVTYATLVPFAREMFAHIPDGQRRWVTQLDRDGTGLFQTSTDRLRGRKMFCWGMNMGGRRWQEFLSEPGEAYVEIQAGLARIQLESLPMPAQAHWTWTEAFGLLEADPGAAHSENWPQAWRAVDAVIEARLPQADLEALDHAFAKGTVCPAEQILARGAGWGALERSRLAQMGQPDRIPAELAFDEAGLGKDQALWLALLKDGSLPERDPEDDPGPFMVQHEWRGLLEEALAAGRGDHWLSWLHVGVIRLEAREPDGAREAWERSVAHRPSAWALRNLAVLEQRAGRHERARDLLWRAWDTGPKVASLAVEYVQTIVQSQDDDALDVFLRNLPVEVRKHERIRILSAKAALRRGDRSEAEALFKGQFATIREGETTLTDLWFSMHEERIAEEESRPVDDELRARVRRECPPPRHIDFRMVADGR